MPKVFLATTSTNLQTYTVPSDWTDSGATVEGLGAGGNGAAGTTGTSGNGGGGGAGGMYAKKTTPGLAASGTVYYQLAAGGSARDTWFNDQNLLLQTNNALTNASWTKSNVTATINQSDPLGGTTAGVITETATNAQHVIIQPVLRTETATTARSYRWSATVKSTTRNIGFVTWLNGSGINAGVGFDLQGTDDGVGTAMTPWTDNAARGTFTSPAITALGSGWYRISATFNILAGGTDTDFEFQITLHNPGSGHTLDYIGSVSANASIYGATCTYGTIDKGWVSTTTLPAYSILAKTGPNAVGTAAATAPAIGTGLGDTINIGGNGGAAGVTRGGGGGGGSGGISGVGKNGGAAGALFGGAGGGGSNGTLATAGANTTALAGTAGGQGDAGTGSGAADTAAASPGGGAATATSGAGGGGGYRSATASTNSAGGAGAITDEFDATRGGGGGGGGGGGNSVNTAGAIVSGGAGGTYGGGGGGSGYNRANGTQAAGTGGQGLIVLDYTAGVTSLGTLAVTLDAMTGAGTGAVTTPERFATLAATFAAMTASATGKVLVQGQLVMGGAGGATPPAFRSQGSVTYGTRTGGTTVPAPAGIVDGDILVAPFVVGKGDANVVNDGPILPAGWAEFGTPTLVTDGGFWVWFRLFWKRAASESGNYAFTHVATLNTECVIKAYSGCTPTGVPFGATSINSGGAQFSLGTGITTTAPNSLLLYETHDWTASGTLTAPPGMTERFESLMLSADQLIATAGATGDRQHTNGNPAGNTSQKWAVRMVELLGQPALVGGFEALTLSAVGSTAITSTGSLAVTLGAMTVAGSGTVANQVFSGTLNITLGAMTGTLTGKVTVGGTAAGTLLPLTLVGTGTAVNQIYSGTLNQALAPLTALGSGTVVNQLFSGTLNATLGDVTLSATGTGLTVATGTLAATFDAASLSASGNVANQVFSGTLTATLGTLTGTLSGKVTVGGTAAGTLLPLALVGTGTVAKIVYSGTLSTTLGALTGTLNGKVTVGGSAAGTLLPLSLVGTGNVYTPAVDTATGMLNVTLGELTLFGKSAFYTKERITEDNIVRITEDGVIRIIEGRAPQPGDGFLEATLAPLTLAGTGTVVNKVYTGTLAATLAPLTLAASGKVIVRGTLGVTLGAMTATMSGRVIVGGTAAGTLLPLMLVGTGTVKNQIFTGTLSKTLDPMTLVGIGNVQFLGYVKVWNGSAWVSKPAKVWTGSAWVRKLAKTWNGSEWVG